MHWGTDLRAERVGAAATTLELTFPKHLFWSDASTISVVARAALARRPGKRAPRRWSPQRHGESLVVEEAASQPR